jgi:hypothetical protein
MSGFDLFAYLGITERDLIKSIIASRFFVDFGIVQAVSADKTQVDVKHAIQPKLFGTQLQTTVTKGVELLWPASAAMAIQWDIAAGDTVLIVGLKDFVKTVNVSSPAPTDVGLHYTQETMKAIPMGEYGTPAQVTINGSGGLLQIKTAAASLYTIIQNLIQGIQGATIVCPPGGGTVYLTDVTTKISQSLIQLGQLLKA